MAAAPQRGLARQDPTIGQALVPICFLIGALAGSVYLFGDESSAGPNQIALILAAGVGSMIGLRNGLPWKDIEGGIRRGLSISTGAILILLVVGSVIGTWILAGVVPTMIYYGLSILSPSVFYAAACLLCAIVATATGSSWTTAGTVGIALIGIATAQNLHAGMAAGAIISGAYFGDKMSPLSDTTNLAPAVAGSDIFDHIRHMLWTTVPSFLGALLLFLVAGLVVGTPDGPADMGPVLDILAAEFAIGAHLLIPVVIVLAMVIRRTPALPSLLIGALLGGVFAVIFQQDAVLAFVDDPELPVGVSLLKGAWIAMYGGFELHSGNPALDDLLSRGGMASMLMTVWLIMAAMTFGGVMETTGMLDAVATRILSFVRGTGSLISATLLTSFGMNVLASDQYMAIVLPGRMFREEYARQRLDARNLSRTLEDSGTLTSVLVPWNTCGAFMAQTLGVSTLSYAPFAFFNILGPLVAAAYGFANIGLKRVEEHPLESPGGGESHGGNLA